METSIIKDNIAQVRRNIQLACERVGRSPDEVTLICVSKTKPVSMIEESYAVGEREYGENKAQELKEKYEVLPEDCHFHMIGHLQTNKIKYILNRACLIHSVDSLHLAQALEEACARKNTECNILIEVNVAGEDSKFGVSGEETLNLVKEIARLPHVHIQGLMTIAPFVDNPEDNRIHFRNLHKLYIDIGSENIDNVSMNVLSMGMTGDYQVAVEEGATHVRVGTGIYGARDYQI